MLNTNANSNQQNKSGLRKTLYEDLDEKQFQKILEEKDRQIRALEFKVKRFEEQNKQLRGNVLSTNQTGDDFFKKKLQQSIKTAQTVIHSSIEMHQRLKKLVMTLKTSVQRKDQSMSQVKSLLDMMSDISISDSSFISQNENQFFDIASISRLQKQGQALIEQLSGYCSILNNNSIKSKKDFTWLQGKYKQSVKQSKDEIASLKAQVLQSRNEKQHTKKLLTANQKQKTQIMKQIASIVDVTTKKQLQKMDRQKLIEFVMKLLFKMSQVEKSKQDVIKQNKKMKNQNLQQYKQMLMEVKQAKQMSRSGITNKLGKSVGY